MNKMPELENQDILISSEAGMLSFGREFAKQLTLPAVIELIGDVGAGKTTFTRGLAQGLGISEPVTSPSFTISNRYPIFSQNPEQLSGELIHYDFYRLGDPGVMRDELTEALDDPNSVIVVEWGTEVSNLLPDSKIQINLEQNDDNTRVVKITTVNPETDLNVVKNTTVPKASL